MEILIEQIEDVKNEIINESENGSKNYYIEGIFIQSNIKNRNNRVYPKDIAKREIDKYITEQIKSGKAVGELNHPVNDPRINYERVSHKFEFLKESGDNWIGRAKITKNTPMGGIVAGLMEEGVIMGVSTRALGSTKLCEDGVRVVQNDFKLISAGDIVSDPSAPDAFVQNLMENKEWIWENGQLIEKEKEIKETINNLSKTKKLNEENLHKLFSYIIKNI